MLEIWPILENIPSWVLVINLQAIHKNHCVVPLVIVYVSLGHTITWIMVRYQIKVYMPLWKKNIENYFCRIPYLLRAWTGYSGNDKYYTVNSSPPSAAYMCQLIGSALVQIMACRLFGAKPLPEPMLAHCQLDSWEQISVKFELEFFHFHSRKCIWNCCLRKWLPFCPGGDELTLTWQPNIFLPTYKRHPIVPPWGWAMRVSYKVFVVRFKSDLPFSLQYYIQ